MKNIITLIFLFLLFNSCATHKAQYKEESEKENIFPDKEIDKTFYLLGDAGLSPLDGMSDGLKAFKTYISDRSTKEDYVLFLGDNIYPAGLPEKDDKKRITAENNLNAQLNSIKEFEGKTIFIPGNHDWYADGIVGLKREEKYIEDAIGKDTFLPENGCPLESIDVSEDIQLIIIDTQWYLENWNKHPTLNDKCEIKTRDRLFIEIEGELKKAQNKTIVFAMHHPMFTNGIHGGQYAFKKHFFPSQKNIPIPLLTSLVAQIRTQGGISIQDRYNESYNNLMNRLQTLATDSKQTVFVSGHEHTLQYIESETIKQIISGSASKESYASLSDNGLFSYGKQGFADFTIFKDRSSWVRFYGQENGTPKLLYQKEVFKARKDYDVSGLSESFPNEVEVSVYTKEETDKSDFFKSVWGNHYRDIYSTKIKVKVATLDTLYGGLEIVRKGGGHQTRSLRLKTNDGKELNMRALRKSATQYLQTVLFKDTYVQDEFEKTNVEGLILDFYTAAHPYAFLVIPDLSNAAELYHTNPKLFYIPKHKHLGEYNAEYGDELYMIEERPEENYSGERTFGYADDIESTHDIIEKIREDEKYKIDETAYIKARLFDMLVGDWDRHQDQWRWAQFDQENGDKLFKPIPRDRDQVFANFDGALLDIVRVMAGLTKQLQVYDAELKDVKWMNSAGIKLDRTLIQQANKETWLNSAKFLQDKITDNIIEIAFNKVPKEVHDKTLEEIKEKLKGRRGNLVDIAERYYNYLNELVILTGTDKDDYIEIIRSGNKETTVKIGRIKGGDKSDILVNRVLNRDITKEIWIYGLDDKDVFEVSGNAKHPIKIRIIGGQENDSYNIKNGRRITVYDHKTKKNTIVKNNGARLKFTNVYNNNIFDYQKYINQFYITTPNIGYNPDDGFLLGLSVAKTVNGFEHNPFTSQHRLNVGYYFATKGLDLRYQGEFVFMGEWNFLLGGVFTTQNFTNNFFGYGNETVNSDDELGKDYNRIKKSIYEASAGFIKRSPFGSDYSFKAIIEGIEIDNTEDRFISEFELFTDENFYDRRFYGGLDAIYNYNSYDSKINPTRGMTFLFDVGGKSEFKDTKNIHGYINSHLGFYNALSRNRKLVLKSKVSTQLRFGDNIPFYQAAQIGGKMGLRGYRSERFTGQNSFVANADLRYSFKSFKTKTLPLQIGVFTGFDLGRVWLKNDVSKKWHNDYGGGFWISSAESISGTFNLFTGDEGLRFSFGFGLNF